MGCGRSLRLMGGLGSRVLVKETDWVLFGEFACSGKMR